MKKKVSTSLDQQPLHAESRSQRPALVRKRSSSLPAKPMLKSLSAAQQPQETKLQKETSNSLQQAQLPGGTETECPDLERPRSSSLPAKPIQEPVSAAKQPHKAKLSSSLQQAPSPATQLVQQKSTSAKSSHKSVPAVLIQWPKKAKSNKELSSSLQQPPLQDGTEPLWPQKTQLKKDLCISLQQLPSEPLLAPCRSRSLSVPELLPSAMLSKPPSPPLPLKQRSKASFPLPQFSYPYPQGKSM